MNKFEKLIEYIINDEDQKARELFHDIVVEKSRDIYESIMDEESMEETVQGHDNVESMVDEVQADEEAMGEEEDQPEDEFSLDSDDDQDGAPEGDFPANTGTEDGPEHAEIEDQVMNIDAKLDELLAKFDEIMGEPAEKPAPEMGMDAQDPAMMEAAEEEDDEEEEEESKGNPFAKKDDKKKTEESRTNRSTSELMREYVDRIGDIYGGAGDANEGDAVGAAGKKTSVNTKYTGKQDGPDFGGNPVKTGGQTANQDGTSPTKASNEYNKGQGEIKSGNVNVPGGKAGTPKSTGDSYEKGGDSQGNPTGKMTGTGAKSEKQGEKNTKSTLVPNSGKK